MIFLICWRFFQYLQYLICFVALEQIIFYLSYKRFVDATFFRFSTICCHVRITPPDQLVLITYIICFGFLSSLICGKWKNQSKSKAYSGCSRDGRGQDKARSCYLVNFGNGNGGTHNHDDHGETGGAVCPTNQDQGLLVPAPIFYLLLRICHGKLPSQATPVHLVDPIPKIQAGDFGCLSK